MQLFTRIKELQKDNDLTQSEKEKILHCTQQAYSHYERGTRDLPTSVLISLADFHETTTDYILGRTNKK